MKKQQVSAFILAVALTTMFMPSLRDTVVGADSKKVTAKDEEVKAETSFLSCRQGDKLSVTLDSEEIKWMTSDENVASVSNDGIISANSKGICDISDIETGYTIKVNVSGETSQASDVLKLNYTSDDSLSDVVVEDETTTVKEIEINSEVKADAGAASKPDSFSEIAKEETPTGSADAQNSPNAEDDIDGTTEMKAEAEGNYVVTDANGESQVVKVIQPELNQTDFTGAVGQSTDVFITNFDTTVKYSSSNDSIATVDENGKVTLVDGGECTIYVDTEYNRLELNIVSKVPTVNTDAVKLKDGEKSQITVEGNDGNLPVRFEIVSGNGTVSETGEVSVPKRDTTVVRTIITGPLKEYTYDKQFTCSSIHEEYWEAMQPAIQECLGTPYVFGGTVPGKGLDCSAYVSYVYRTVGLMNSRLTAQGIYNISTPTDDPQPGDLVFFTGTYDTSDYITHIGIYAGNNQMYHSGDPNKLASLNTAYWQSHIVGYGTMITEDMQSPTIHEVDVSSGTTYGGYSQQELELIWAIVAQECNVNYDGALAVVTCAANRADINYGGHGTDVLSQLTAPGQFAYSPSVSDPSLWQARLNGNVPEHVKKAVSDCLESGVRNHSYLSFRSNPVGDNSVNIGGNWYF